MISVNLIEAQIIEDVSEASVSRSIITLDANKYRSKYDFL